MDDPTPGQADAAWSEAVLRTDPHTAADKALRVRKMFAAIAPSYDFNNRLHSLGRDRAWRRRAVDLCGVTAADLVLDVACGTGDLALTFARQGPAGVIGLDFTGPMLKIGLEKIRKAGLACPIALACSDAQRLPLPDRSVDVAGIAFGIRNVQNPAAAVAEFHRVLKPGGRLCILEFSLPRPGLLRKLFLFYFHHVMSRTEAWVARDRSGAYRYLPRSIDTFLGQQDLLACMERAGFQEVRAHPMTFGVAVAYLGSKK